MGYVAPSLWNDEKVRNLPLATKAVFAYLLTGPESLLIPGLINGDSDSLAGPLRASIPEVEGCLVALITARLVERDRGDRIIRVPNAPRYNAPPNGNVLNAWYKRWLQFTEGPLRNAHVASVRAAVELRIAEATKKKAKKGVVESWKEAWEETFGTLNIHARQRDLFTQVNTSQLPYVKPFDKPFTAVANGPGQLVLAGECANSVATGSSSLVATSSSRERDQGVKPLVERSLPDPDPRSLSQILIPDPDPRSRSGVLGAPEPSEWASGTSPGTPVARSLQDRAAWAWSRQEQLRKELGLRAREPTEGLLALVAACLQKHDDTVVEHVLQSYAANTRWKAELGKWFDGESNWVLKNFEKAVFMPIRKNNGAVFTPSADENYDEGGTEVPELGPGVRQML